MPQMAPMNWILLFCMFSITLITFCTLNYYIYKPTMMKTFNMAPPSDTASTYKWLW